ncbi:serine--tRNA ligase [Candidatus Woesebacteria bacterium]|nr:serine--tRNA ligase [Candidatus Woesebacteria bacterium]QQG47886.1 MAG: serine--tRNA ligase [Candidatus Woesebacteria bacterium]
MLDIQFIRENPDEVKKGISSKNINPNLVDKLLKLDETRKSLILEIENLRSQRNKIAKEGKASIEGKKIKDELKTKEPELEKIEKEYKKTLFEIPNLPKDDVKIGKNDTENEILRKWGEPKKFDFPIKDHLVLGEKLGIIDTERASKVSGARFAYLKADAALLEFALLSFAMETLVKVGFIPVIPPVLIKKEMMSGMGYLEHGGEEDMYILDKDNMILIGTSEQSIGPMHANEVLDVKKPIRYAGFSSCFRREAGSYGKDTKGIIRVHQFDKVEMFSFIHPDKSEEEHEFLLNLEEKLLQSLEIPYQVVKMCSGDLGTTAARKYDLEGWIPSQNKYRELTSTSTVTDFQARRLNIKFREKGQIKFVHMLNGTAFAMGRTIVAIIENNQQKDGSIVVPEVLRKWFGKDKIAHS